MLRLNGAFPQARIDALARRSDVMYVERHRVRETQLATPDDPSYSTQWPLAIVRAFEAWRLVPGSSTPPGSRVRVAVLDTGTDCTHPDFKGLSGSIDVLQGGQLNLTSSRAIVTTTISPAACPWQDDHGHGTHVAGTIAASSWNKTGVASLGFPLEIVTLKVLGADGSGGSFGGSRTPSSTPPTQAFRLFP